MEIQKILLSFRSGVITPIESDTLLSYIFALDFANTKEIFQKLLNKETVPFVFSNAMMPGELPRPFYFAKKKEVEFSLDNALAAELERKKNKTTNVIGMKKSDLSWLFEEGVYETFESGIKSVKIAEFKNTLPRFNKSDTLPYTIPSVSYTEGERVVYVRIFDKLAFEYFFQQMKKILVQYGFWAGKARGYGKIASCSLLPLSNEEALVFDYIHDLRDQGKIYVLNNYKPSQSEILAIDVQKSNYQIHTKQAKKWEGSVFKGPLSFFAPGSVLQINEKRPKKNVYGDFYESNQSFNFWYLF